MKIVSKPNHGDAIAEKQNGLIIPTPEFQNYLDELELRLNNYLLGDSVKLPSYTVSALPTASKNTNGMIYVSDETGGAVTAFSDGTSWRRTTDRAIVS